MAGKPTTILSWFAQRRMESSTCRSWSIMIKVGNTLPVLPFIPVNIRSTRMAKWFLPIIQGQDHLCLVGLRRAECMEDWRQEHFVHGAVFREHQSSECLLPIRRTGRCLSGREERVRSVGPVRPLPAGFRIFAGSNVEKTADGIHFPSAIVPIHQKRQWRFHGAQCPTLCEILK